MQTRFVPPALWLTLLLVIGSAAAQAQSPAVTRLTGTPMGFVASIQDGQTHLVAGTLQLWLDDVELPFFTVTGPDAGGVSTVIYAEDQALPNHTTHRVKLQFKDDAKPVASTITHTASFDVAYATIPAAYAITQFSGTKGTMRANVHQLPFGATRGPGDANSVANAETELAGGFIDPATGEPYENIAVADPVAVGVVNASDSVAGTAAEAGWFNATNTPEYADQEMPQSTFGDQYAVQFVAYAELKPGAYRMYVNSDDGFRLTAGLNGPDVAGTLLGQFDGGRGSVLNGDPVGFDVVVTQAGIYPLRLAYWEGSGDANVEWYTQDVVTGQRYMVNAGVAGAVQTYPEGHGRAYVARLLPFPGKTGVPPQTTITADLVDDLTTVDPASIKLTLDGATLSPTITSSGKTNRVAWTAPAAYPLESKHTGQLSYREKENGQARVVELSFAIKGYSVEELPATSFWIEAEDFDYDAGKFGSDGGIAQSVANVMPYTGGAFQGLSAVHDVDYHRTGPGPVDGTELGGYMYRTFGLEGSGWLDAGKTQPAYFVPFYQDTGGIAGQRPDGNVVTLNYRTGWSGGGNWYNYTRSVPPGIYAAFLAAGHWNDTDAAAAGQIDCDLARVVAGAGTSNQTLQVLGTWYGPGAGFSAADVLTPLKATDGSLAIFKADGTTTLRLTDRAGDIDWLVLAPQTDVPPKITQAIPANGAVVGRNTPISVRIEDFTTAAVLATVKLEVDGQDVTAQANPAKSADITTLQYTPATLWVAGSEHVYLVRYNDTSVPAKSFATTNTFLASALGAPGQFVIEAEDFNYGGGQAKAVASTMPYLGGAYAGLDAAYDVDYHSENADQIPNGYTPAYRATGKDANVVKDGRQLCLDANGGVQASRGTWDVATNFKVGWSGNHAWQNFTRTFPAGTYNVYAGLSYGGTEPHQLDGSLALVTSGATTTTQTLVELGTFDAPGTGGWGLNTLVPLKDAGGALATVNLSGAQTVRFFSTSGDEDFFLFVPGAAVTAPVVVTPPASVAVASGGSATFSAAVSGTGPLRYQWKLRGEVLAGQTNRTLSIANATCAQAGSYTVTVTGPTGASVDSAAATLTVAGCDPLKFTAVKVNANGTLTVEWTGGGTLQTAPAVTGPWTAVPGATSPQTFSPTQKAQFARLVQ